IPLKTVAPATVDVREVAVLVRRRGRVLLVRRPEHGRWSNMWEFPHGELRPDESLETGAERLLAELTGLTASIGPELMTIRHGVMHYRITMTCLEAQQQGGTFHSAFYVEARWLPPARLAEFPVSSPQRKLTKELSRGVRQRRLF